VDRTSLMTAIETNWEKFLSMEISDKIPYFTKNGRMYDCLFAQQFNRDFLEHLFKVADKLRKITKQKDGMEFAGNLLNHKRAMLYFVQPSTRTFHF